MDTAIKFGRRPVDLEAVTDATVSNCERHQKAPQDAWDEFCVANQPVDIDDCGARYNPGGEIRRCIIEDQVDSGYRRVPRCPNKDHQTLLER